MAKNQIGLRNEGSLHSAIKKWYSLPGDQFEVRMDGFIIDIVRENLLIEIQTRNFSSISHKLRSLLRDHNVRLIYPISRLKRIVRVDKENAEILSKRKSPKKGKLTDLFNELVRIPELINTETFSLEVLIIEEEEIRCDDGNGSWRRKGVSIQDRKLINVIESVQFNNRNDFRKFLPEKLIQPFSNKNLSKSIGISINQARKMSYSLKKMGVIKEVGKSRNELLFGIIT